MKTHIWIDGEPTKLTHQSSLKTRGRSVYTTAKYKQELIRLAQEMRVQQSHGTYICPLRLWITITRQSDTVSVDTSRPDLDNQLKIYMDALTLAKIIVDDSQFVDITARKLRGPQNGIGITIETL